MGYRHVTNLSSDHGYTKVSQGIIQQLAGFHRGGDFLFPAVFHSQGTDKSHRFGKSDKPLSIHEDDAVGITVKTDGNVQPVILQELYVFSSVSFFGSGLRPGKVPSGVSLIGITV